MKKNVLSRRNFIRVATMVSGSVLLFPRCSKVAESPYRFFTVKEALLVDALAEQIIPTDEWPGGRDAGVTSFIDRQIMGPYKRYGETYRKGLQLIREASLTKFQKPFEEISWEEQTLFLKTMEAGKMGGGWEKGFDRQFFGLIRSHSLQGFYGSPRHGGNKNNISYKMLQLDYPVIIGQNRYHK